MARRVLLLGTGPTHLQLLQALARQPLAGAEVALLSPFAQQVQAPLLPGVVAGHRPAASCLLPLQPLAAAAQVHFIEGQALALDAAARCVNLGNGRRVDYDLLSMNTPPLQDRDRIPGARERGLFLRPHEPFARLLEGLWDLAARRVLDVVVVGGGVEAVELALALAWRLGSGADERARVALVTGGDAPLAGCPAGLQQRAQRALARRRITVFRDHCRAVEPGAVVLGQGARLACDAPVLAMPGEAPPWLASSGLALDASGWVATGPTLQSLSNPEVLAVSKVATGVARTLEANLRGLVGGGPLSLVKPCRQPPSFVETGDRRALVAWGRLSAEGRWVQRWKDRREASGFSRSA